MAAPPPPTPETQLLELMDEPLEEILLRLPPDKPVWHVDATLVCKCWCRLLTDPGFWRRFSEFHRTSHMLGLIIRCCSPAAAATSTTTGFLPTASFHPCDAGSCTSWSPVDARHGRILFFNKPVKNSPATNEIIVWTPATGAVRILPKLWLPCSRSWVYWNAALLCAAPGCSHIVCPGPFTVVLVGENVFSMSIQAYIYSSEADEWICSASLQELRYVQQRYTYSALVGNALYFPLRCNSGILEYDLGKNELSVIGLPTICKASTALVLMSVDDDRLGFAMVHDDLSLGIWLRESAPDPSGGWTWTQHRVVDLESFLPVSALSSSPCIVAAAEAIGVFLIRVRRDDGGVLAIDLKSGRVREVSDANGYILNIIPYISFCSPALRVATVVDERPSMGASNNT